MSKYAGEMKEGAGMKWWNGMSVWKKVVVLAVAPVLLGGAVGFGQRALSDKQGVAVQDCPCAESGLCTGPRGGRYCVDDSGNKRYKPRQ